MAHELTQSDYMVSGSNITPWHGLGAIFDGQLSAIDALRLARLDWDVIQEAVFDSDMIEVPSHKLNRRSDNLEVLGVVSKDWEPLQNARLLEIAEAIAQVDANGFKPVIETAGSLKGGRIVWALVHIGQRNFADSEHRTYLLLSNGHDGLRGIRGTLTDVRVVCNNTLSIAERAASQLFVTHAKGVEKRVDEALRLLGWANEATGSTFAIYNALASARVSVDTAHGEYRRLVAGASSNLTNAEIRTVEGMTNLFRHGAGVDGKTAFDFMNAVTEWVDHSTKYRDNSGKAERRFLSTTFGQGASLKAAGYKVAKQLAGV